MKISHWFRISELKTRIMEDESGAVLIVALFFLVAGSLIVTTLLGFVTSGLSATRQTYEKKTEELYAADAGIKHVQWEIKYDHLDGLTDPKAYSPYDFSTTWPDPYLSQTVNGRTVNASIKNVWIPSNIPVPGENEAKQIIENNKLVVTGNTEATGITVGSSSISRYRIKITYYPSAGESLNITSLGIWLPQSFDYFSDSSHKSSLEDNPQAEYYSIPSTQDHAGNKAAIWSFNSVPYSSFPNVHIGDYPMITEITFYFKPPQTQPDQKPEAVAWITTSGVPDIAYSWDADTRVYQMISEAGSTTVESHIAKSKLRQLKSSTAGDYYATGNTLMIDNNHDSYGIRDQLLSSSSSTVATIPGDAEVAAAYLYWSGWRDESSKVLVFTDGCSSFTNWVQTGSNWTINSTSRFRGHYNSGTDDTRYLTLKNNQSLSSYSSGNVFVCWDQWVGGSPGDTNGLDFSFSADGGLNWSNNIPAFRGNIGTSAVKFAYSIPNQYLTGSFKMRFFLVGFGGSNQYCYIDNIRIWSMPPDTSIVFKIDGMQVYFDGTGQPSQGLGEVTSTKNQVLPNYDSSGAYNGFSYSCYRDVTALVRKYSAKAPDPAINYPGNATYTVGAVTGTTANQWSYAGWSIIIIYTSAATQGHQLYLYDKFIYAHNNTDIDFDNDAKYGGTISGFVVPQPITGEVDVAKMTCFVGEGDNCWSGDFLAFNAPSSYWANPGSDPWSIPLTYKLWDGTTGTSNGAGNPNNVWNSKSLVLSADGVDIDTFSVTWASSLLSQGDTSAHIDLPTYDDSWNLVYIILSFRSSTTTGGALNYLVRQ
jgi:hypothetical protein